jgi:hypothetical protein
MQEAGLRHRATAVTLTTIRQDNGETEQVWVEGTTVPALFVVAGSRIAELAAARGVQATGVLKLRRGTQVDVGQRYRVTGIQQGVQWSRLLEVTADLSEDTERIVRRVLVVETELD